jgi:hypothetical protein
MYCVYDIDGAFADTALTLSAHRKTCHILELLP